MSVLAWGAGSLASLVIAWRVERGRRRRWWSVRSTVLAGVGAALGVIALVEVGAVWHEVVFCPGRGASPSAVDVVLLGGSMVAPALFGLGAALVPFAERRLRRFAQATFVVLAVTASAWVWLLVFGARLVGCA